VGASVGFPEGGSVSINFSSGPLFQQIQKCKELSIGLPNYQQEVVQSMMEAFDTLSSSLLGVVDVQAAISQSSAKCQSILNEYSLAQARAKMEESLTTRGLTTTFGLYRMYHAYDLWRARAMVENARRFAVASRRSLEAYFNVDLSTMSADEAFVKAPATWADQIYDYDLSLPAAVGVVVGQPQDGAIYSNKIEDYILNLDAFVNGFAVNRPSALARNEVDVVTLPGLGRGTPVEDPAVVGSNGMCCGPGCNTDANVNTTSAQCKAPTTGGECVPAAPGSSCAPIGGSCGRTAGTGATWANLVQTDPDTSAAATRIAQGIRVPATPDFLVYGGGDGTRITGVPGEVIVVRKTNSGGCNRASLYVKRGGTVSRTSFDNSWPITPDGMESIQVMFDGSTENYVTVGFRNFCGDGTDSIVDLNVMRYRCPDNMVYGMPVTYYNQVAGVCSTCGTGKYYQGGKGGECCAAQSCAAGQVLKNDTNQCCAPSCAGTGKAVAGAMCCGCSMQDGFPAPSGAACCPCKTGVPVTGGSSYPGQGNWTLRCPNEDGGNWVSVAAGDDMQTVCGANLSPDRARLEFSLDPWGRLTGSALEQPFSRRYNTRWGALAVNIVGTAIRNCELASDPAGCYSTGFIPFDLVHTGPAWVTDYEGRWRILGVPVGRIEGAKALAVERWLDPLKDGWETSYIKPVARSEFEFRPVGGGYALEFELTPDVMLDHIDRVQLLIGSSYWVKQD
jgi:hypothetical protein